MGGVFLAGAERSGPKKLTKTYNKGFPNHSSLINYVSIVSLNIQLIMQNGMGHHLQQEVMHA